jgi:hypothetical protein
LAKVFIIPYSESFPLLASYTWVSLRADYETLINCISNKLRTWTRIKNTRDSITVHQFWKIIEFVTE